VRVFLAIKDLGLAHIKCIEISLLQLLFCPEHIARGSWPVLGGIGSTFVSNPVHYGPGSLSPAFWHSRRSE